MLAKSTCILFSILILTWLSGGDAQCAVPAGLKVKTAAARNDSLCCAVNTIAPTTCPDTCQVTAFDCIDGYTKQTADGTTILDTSNCTSTTWDNLTKIEALCVKNCDIPTGLKVKTDHATTACCAAGKTDNCPPGCTPAEFDCVDGYTIQAIGTNVVNTATCSPTGTTWTDDAKLAALCVKITTKPPLIITTTAATTTTTSGAGDLNMTKSIILFVSSVMVLIF